MIAEAALVGNHPHRNTAIYPAKKHILQRNYENGWGIIMNI